MQFLKNKGYKFRGFLKTSARKSEKMTKLNRITKMKYIMVNIT